MHSINIRPQTELLFNRDFVQSVNYYTRCNHTKQNRIEFQVCVHECAIASSVSGYWHYIRMQYRVNDEK